MKTITLLRGFRDSCIGITIIAAVLLHAGYAFGFAVFALLSHFALQEIKENK